jgi:hypothetical protein
MNVSKTIKDEPLYIGGGLSAIAGTMVDGLVADAVATAVSYGVNITPEAASLIGTIAAGLVFVVGLWATRHFTSPAYKLDEANQSQFRPGASGD